MHPAPRMISAPVANSAMAVTTELGDAVGSERVPASSVDQRHGVKRYSTPVGLSSRINSAYGTSDEGKWERRPEVGGVYVSGSVEEGDERRGTGVMTVLRCHPGWGDWDRGTRRGL